MLSVASPICQEGQSARTILIFAFSSQFFLLFPIFFSFSRFFSDFPPLFPNFWPIFCWGALCLMAMTPLLPGGYAIECCALIKILFLKKDCIFKLFECHNFFSINLPKQKHRLIWYNSYEAMALKGNSDARPNFRVFCNYFYSLCLISYRKFFSNRIGASKRDIWMRVGNVIAPSLKY